MEILKDWGDLLAVNKPAGWLTVPGRGNKEDVPILSHELGKKVRRSFLTSASSPSSLDKPDLYVIHRLDQGTSGVVLFARTPETHREYSMKFENGEIKKTYLALVSGPLQSQIVDAPLLKLPSKKNKSVVSAKGKSAQTVFRPLNYFKDCDISIIEATPLTGRTHQIRVHLAHIGYPILGDKLYGGSMDLQGRKLTHPLLHALRLEFQYKGSLESVECGAPWIQDFRYC